jgi:erythromycin esterase
MKLNPITFFACLGFLSPVLSCCGTPEDAFIEWAGKRAIPIATVEPGSGFDNLEALADFIGEARIVCLGESRHDASEQFRLKHRLVEYLVKEKGFTLFAIEDSLPCSMRINDFVLGGEGTAEGALEKLGAWYIWETEELLALVKWMRAHNDGARPGKKVRFHGIDITEPRTGLEKVLACLDRVDPDHAAAIRTEPALLDLFDPAMWSKTVENYTRLTAGETAALDERFDALLSRIEKHRVSYVAASSEKEYLTVARLAENARQGHALFSTAARSGFDEAGPVREKAMAANITRLAAENRDGPGLIVWAHNLHVARDTLDITLPGRPPMKGAIPMMCYLDETLATDTICIGFSFACGEFPDGGLPLPKEGSVDSLLAQTGPPLFLIDLRTAPKEGLVHEWLSKKRTMRAEGGTVDLIPRRAFDALIFVRTISPTRRSPRTKARIEALEEG